MRKILFKIDLLFTCQQNGIPHLITCQHFFAIFFIFVLTSVQRILYFNGRKEVNELNKRLIELRKLLDKSQAEFASSIGLSRNFWSLVENGDRKISDRTIADICRVYRVNEDWLRAGSGEMFAPTDREGEIAKITLKMLDAGNDIRTQLTSILWDMDEKEMELLRSIVLRLAQVYKKDDQ